MGEEKVRTVVGEAPLPPAIPPPSPSVSGLGSLPLTRVATPMVPRLGPRSFFFSCQTETSGRGAQFDSPFPRPSRGEFGAFQGPCTASHGGNLLGAATENRSTRRLSFKPTACHVNE